MSRIFALVAVVLVLGAGAAAIDYAHDDSNVDGQEFQNETAKLSGDMINTGQTVPLIFLAAIVFVSLGTLARLT